MYLPDKKSLAAHPVPEWFHDAKLGIFIHWGLYSIPAFAVTEYGDITRTMQRGFEFHFTNNPYAEWYLNSLRITGSPTQAFHHAQYGDCPYMDFAQDFNTSLVHWQPQVWASLFRRAGARYAVLTTKHHDGFLLYPSEHPNPIQPDYHAVRDIPGELKDALSQQGMRFGTYYSGALDWTFTQEAITDVVGLLVNGPASTAYGAYVDAHFRELVRRYQPDVLWNDIGYPPMGHPLAVIADYYNQNPQGVVNDRWSVSGKQMRGLVQWKPVRRLINRMAMKMILQGKSAAGSSHSDFRTPEYQQMAEATPDKWEACQGLGYSFGYNRMDTADTYLSSEALIHLLVEVVSKNGNLLINVGPDGQGQIPPVQQERLLALGAWLEINGEAIYGTRPWLKAEATDPQGIPLRFTRKGDALYAIPLERMPRELVLPGMCLAGPVTAVRLADGAPLQAENTPTGLRLSAAAACDATAPAIRLEPARAVQLTDARGAVP
ncbi:MAG: alpha-L-fucosidase [Anaerolineae bacterium]|nr:alpha-L-fucosidase [Anaerolineae bacterium]